MGYKSMATPMLLNLNKLHVSASSSNPIDPMMCQQLIKCLMYLMHTKPNICFAVGTLRHVHWVSTKHILRYHH